MEYNMMPPLRVSDWDLGNLKLKTRYNTTAEDQAKINETTLDQIAQIEFLYSSVRQLGTLVSGMETALKAIHALASESAFAEEHPQVSAILKLTKPFL